VVSVISASQSCRSGSPSTSEQGTPIAPEDCSLPDFFGPDEAVGPQATQELLLEGILSVDKDIHNACGLAKRMLSAYGSLAKLLSSPVEDIARLPGVSRQQADVVHLSYKALVNCVFDQIKERPSLDYDALIAMALWTIGQSTNEKVLLFFLDRRGRVSGMETLCSGSESFVSVSVKTVIAAACRKNASAFLIAHNHPAGSLSPSQQDLEFVDNLLRASSLMQMSIVDSLIVSENSWYSFREAGRL
jgi:DNA repair protein RadC